MLSTDRSGAERRQATYEEIKKYIAQIKQKHGIIERENYNKPKSEKGGQPECQKDFLVICKYKAKEV